MTTRLTRRVFLQRTATSIAAAPLLVSASVLGADGTVPPSEQIRVGFIGTGDHGMGWNMPPYLRHKMARVVAVCDVDSKRLRRAKETVDAKYGNEDCFATKDFREVLARKDIDTVMISTPDHWHTLISALAHRGGQGCAVRETDADDQ